MFCRIAGQRSFRNRSSGRESALISRNTDGEVSRLASAAAQVRISKHALREGQRANHFALMMAKLDWPRPGTKECQPSTQLRL